MYVKGDVNGDGTIDIKDIALAGLAFGSYPDHQRWNPIADASEDDKLDMRDLAFIAKHFGKEYP